MSIINVKWGKERIRVPFPADPSNTPLRSLRSYLAEHTGLPAERFKLVYSGAIMRDDSAPLSAYRLKPGCTIALVGTAPGEEAVPSSYQQQQPMQRPKSSKVGGGGGYGAPGGGKGGGGPMTQQGTLRAIEAELETVRTQLAPGVQAFLASLSSGANLHANYGSGSGARPAPASRSPSITPPRSPSSSITLPPPMSSSVAPAPAHARQPSSSSTPTPSDPSSRPLARPSNPSYNRQQPQQQQPPSPTYPAYPSPSPPSITSPAPLLTEFYP